MDYCTIMCGKFVISSDNPFGLKYKTSYNIVPSQFIPVKMKDDIKLMKWSYAPSWKKDMNLINCRSKTMDAKPSFKNAKRCIIFHNGWYEWQRKDKEKIKKRFLFITMVHRIILQVFTMKLVV